MNPPSTLADAQTAGDGQVTDVAARDQAAQTEPAAPAAAPTPARRRAPKAAPAAEGPVREAPGPSGPISNGRNLLRLQKNCPALFLDLSRQYGDLVRLPLGPYLTYLNTSPEGVNQVLVANNANYLRGPMYERFKIFFGEGLLTTDGAEWKRRRQRVTPAFHKTAIERMTGTMTDATGQVLDRWFPAAATRTPVDVLDDVMDIALDAMGRILFSTELAPVADTVRPAMAVSLEAMIFKGTISQMTPEWVPTPYQHRIRQAVRVLDKQVRTIVDRHRTSVREPGDMVDLILASAGGPTPSYREVRDEMTTVFMAGHETTGTGLGWMMLEVAANPHVQEEACTEVDRVLGDRVPTFDDLARLPYTRRIVDEVLRLHPPIWLFPRQAQEADAIKGMRIDAGSSVFMVPYVTHRNPELWPEPERFDPDRFLPEAVSARPRFAYLPFGGGQRQCVGNQMALLQMHLTLAMTLQRYRLTLAGRKERQLATLVSLRPTDGFPVRFEIRHA
ncbi:MAG: cytochrome P450 [Dermatophilus congolensis]|nr:cytochrome P450 [Dermatophilus congolensis]